MADQVTLVQQVAVKAELWRVTSCVRSQLQSEIAALTARYEEVQKPQDDLWKYAFWAKSQCPRQGVVSFTYCLH